MEEEKYLGDLYLEKDDMMQRAREIVSGEIFAQLAPLYKVEEPNPRIEGILSPITPGQKIIYHDAIVRVIMSDPTKYQKVLANRITLTSKDGIARPLADADGPMQSNGIA